MKLKKYCLLILLPIFCLLFPPPFYSQKAVDRQYSAASLNLLQAVQRQDHSEIQWLLGTGASVNVADGYGRTALMWAASQADIVTCQWLYQHGANLNQTDQK